MTPMERAKEAVSAIPYTLRVHDDELRSAIASAIVEATNEEVAKRRALEAELANVRAGSPVIVATSERVTLRVWNPHTGTWWECNMIQMPKTQESA